MNVSIFFYFKIFLMMECFAGNNHIQENLRFFKKKSVQKMSERKERVCRNETYSAI